LGDFVDCHGGYSITVSDNDRIEVLRQREYLIMPCFSLWLNIIFVATSA
jgi:hypothetical protein